MTKPIYKLGDVVVCWTSQWLVTEAMWLGRCWAYRLNERIGLVDESEITLKL